VKITKNNDELNKSAEKWS